MIHVNCGGHVFEMDNGRYYCLNCGQDVPEREIAREFEEADDE